MKKLIIIFFVFCLVCVSVMEANAGRLDQQVIQIPLESYRISDHIIIVRTKQGGGNQIALNTDKGIVIFGTHWGPDIGLEYNKIIEKEFKRHDFRFVINPSSRIMRIGGNVLYQNAFIIAQADVYQEMVENKQRLDDIVIEERNLFKRKAERSRNILKESTLGQEEKT